MIKRLKQLALIIVLVNIALILITLGLSWQARLLNPMQGVGLVVDGQRMHVIDHGPSEQANSLDTPYDALVLIHGASTNALDFSTNLLPALSIQHRVLAVDRPGHGYSDRGDAANMHHPRRQAERILDTVAALGVSSPVLVGHSWGASVVMAALLLEHPTVSPTAAVLIAGVTHPWPHEHTRPTQLALKPIYGFVFRYQYLTPIGRFMIAPTLERASAPEPVPDNYIRDTGLFLSLRPQTYLNNALDRSNLSAHLEEQSRYYGSLTVPLLSIASGADNIVNPRDHHDRLREQLSSIRSLVFEDAGHMPHHTRTETVVGEIQRFLKEALVQTEGS